MHHHDECRRYPLFHQILHRPLRSPFATNLRSLPPPRWAVSDRMCATRHYLFIRPLSHNVVACTSCNSFCVASRVRDATTLAMRTASLPTPWTVAEVME